MKFQINPFPAVRVNWKGGRFMPRAIKYHNNIQQLRSMILNPLEIMQSLIKWNYRLEFIIEMPKSWSKKKKKEMEWQPHRQTPDIDNLFKAFTDTVFYKQDNYNDKEIYTIKAYKYWGVEWAIYYYITR